MDNKKVASAHATATVLDLAYNQNSNQWQRIGNMQSSAGTILTVISIIASLMVGTIAQITDLNNLLLSLSIFSYSFYITLIFSFIYLIIAAICVFKVIKSKYVNVLKCPEGIQENVIEEISSELESCNDAESIALLVDTNVMLKINEEIKNVEEVLVKNQKNYNKCLKASFLSLLTIFLTLGHVISHIFSNNIFYISIIGILGYLSILGLIFIFIQRSEK